MKNSYTPKYLPIQNIKWESFIHLLGKANMEIGKFDALLQNIPNPDILLTPLITNEAVLSSVLKVHGNSKEVLEFEANHKEHK